MDFGMKIFLVIRTLDQRMFIYLGHKVTESMQVRPHFSSVITEDTTHGVLKYVQVHPPPVAGIVTKSHILHRIIRDQREQLTLKYVQIP